MAGPVQFQVWGMSSCPYNWAGFGKMRVPRVITRSALGSLLPVCLLLQSPTSFLVSGLLAAEPRAPATVCSWADSSPFAVLVWSHICLHVPCSWAPTSSLVRPPNKLPYSFWGVPCSLPGGPYSRLHPSFLKNSRMFNWNNL